MIFPLVFTISIRSSYMNLLVLQIRTMNNLVGGTYWLSSADFILVNVFIV